MKSDIVDVTVALHYQTDKAVLVSDDGTRERAVWLPKSAIEIEPLPNSKFFVVSLPERLAIDKGLV